MINSRTLKGKTMDSPIQELSKKKQRFPDSSIQELPKKKQRFYVAVVSKEERAMAWVLLTKVYGKPCPKDLPISIHECDLYGQNPWEIWEHLGGSNNKNNNSALYLLSTINKIKPSRTIGLGSWEPQRQELIKIQLNGTINLDFLKKYLRFDKSGTNHDGAWILHEYSYLHSTPSAEGNFVLCKLFKNQENPSGEARTCATGGSVTLLESGKAARKQQEEVTQLLPNPFAMDLLLERLHIKYFGNIQK